jgi:hypothetical protein
MEERHVVSGAPGCEELKLVTGQLSGFDRNEAADSVV